MSPARGARAGRPDAAGSRRTPGSRAWPGARSRSPLGSRRLLGSPERCAPDEAREQKRGGRRPARGGKARIPHPRARYPVARAQRRWRRRRGGRPPSLAFPSFRPPARLLSSPLAPGDRVRENCPLAAPIPAPGPRARRSLARRARDIDKPRPFVATPRAATPPAPFRTPTHTRGPGAVADARGREPGLPGRAGQGGAPPCMWPADRGWDRSNPPDSKPSLLFAKLGNPTRGKRLPVELRGIFVEEMMQAEHHRTPGDRSIYLSI